MRYQINKNTGFTLVELMLATAFIGSLLLVITMVIMQVTSLYNRGLTIKEVNAVSRVVVRDMQQSIANSDVFALRYQDEDRVEVASSFGQLKGDRRSDYYTNDAGGRLCTGSYSYAWNTGRAIKYAREHSSATEYEGSPIQLIPNEAGDGNSRLVGFVKVRDTQKRLCHFEGGAGDSTNYARFLPGGNTGANYQNVFGEGNTNLVLYSIEFDAPNGGEPGAVIGAGTSLRSTVSYYTVKMVIGTQMGDEELISGITCKKPADATVNDGEYCAVNEIDFVARSGAAG